MALLAVCAVLVGTLVWAGVAQPWSASAAGSGAIGPHDALITQVEQQRQVAGSQTREITLTAAPVTLDVGGQQVSTWAFNGQVPGPAIQAQAGDVVRAHVINQLPAPLTVHWHGIALRNDMDGVPDLTQPAIAPGGEFDYEFTVATAGTYFYHSHVGVQLDRGLYGPLVITDKLDSQNGAPQRDITMMLDDWLDGTGRTPDEALAELKATGGGMGGMDMGSTDMGGMDMGGMDHGSGTGAATNSASPLGTDTADVAYPLYLINGKSSVQPTIYDVTPGEQVRLRLVNSAASTPFRVASGSGPMTVIATDGYPVEPVPTDSLIIGMGERYDVLVTVPQTGSVPIVAVVEGKVSVDKSTQTMSVLRTPGAALPSANARPVGLRSQPISQSDLHATTTAALPTRTPDRTYQTTLTGGMMNFNWGIEVPAEAGVTLPVRQGERVRLVLTNDTMMWHPIHLHGHTFQVDTGNGPGPRKDTAIISPMSTVTVEFDADNPGQWMLHCHNAYHAEAGMMTTVNYMT